MSRWRRPAPTPDTLPDTALMQGMPEGDDEAFAHLVGRHECALFNYPVHMVQDEALAIDLMQETWLRVFQHASRYDASRQCTTWLYTIA